MKYITFKILMKNRDKVLIPYLYDSATGTGTDTTTDSNITKDPNDYLAPRADGKINMIEYLIIVALIIGIVWLFLSVLKQSKTL